MADETVTRRCIGSARFGIEPHEAPVEDFPRQPSQKDGLGRMCKPHWNAYTAGLARDAKARKAGADGEATASGQPTDEAAAQVPVELTVEAPAPRRRGAKPKAAPPEGDAA